MFLNFNDESGCIKIASSWVESLQLNVSQTINYCTLEVMREDDEHLKEIICFWKFLRTSVIFGTAGLFLASRNLNCCYTTFTSHLPARFYEYFLTWGLTHAEHLLPDSDVWRCSVCVAQVLGPHDLFCFLHFFSLHWLSGEFAGMFTRGEIGCLECCT